VPFEPQSLHRYAEVPDAVRRYYASVEPGSDLALFLGIPHVLYRGRIDLTFEGVEIVDV
jgi:anaerobic selenocysteine-containing dehydrogenase